MDISFLPKKA